MNTMKAVTIGVLILVIVLLSISLFLESSSISRIQDQLIAERQELLEQRHQAQIELIQLRNDCQFLMSDVRKVAEYYDRRSTWQRADEMVEGIPRLGNTARGITL